MVDDHLDTLIDDVAKTMTAAPADPELARRVSMRIAEEGDRRMLRPWVLVPVASACVVLLAVFVARERPGRQDAGPERPGPRNPRVTASPALLPAPSMTLERIDVDRLDVQPLVEMDAIQISPIAIDRIEIAAMP